MTIFNKKLFITIFSLALFFLFSGTSFAAIAFDATSSWSGSGDKTSLTVAHTVTGNNSYVVTAVGTYGSSCGGYAMTYNGNSMSKQVDRAFDGGEQFAMFTYANGTADGASHNLVWTGTNCQPFSMVTASYTGVAQTTPEASSSAAAASVDVPTYTNNAWVIGGTTGTYTTPGANTTERVKVLGIFNGAILESSFNPITPTSTAVSINITSGAENVVGAISLAPAGATPPTTSLRKRIFLWFFNAIKPNIAYGADYSISGKTLTKTEYTNLKTSLISKVSNQVKMSFSEKDIWTSIINYEIGKCGRIILKNIKNSSSIINRVNILIKDGKCSE